MTFKKFILPILAIMAILLTEGLATQKKLPLTPKRYGNVNSMEWTGTTFAVLSADTLSFYADTANSYAADPLRLLFNYPVERGEEQVYPGFQVFEKVCGFYVLRGEADSTTVKYDMFYSTTKNGTFYRANQSGATAYADSSMLGTTTLAGNFAKFEAVPARYWLPKLRVSSATDTANIVEARFWGCND